MKRSEINTAIAKAGNCFYENGWALPPDPKWDVTDFGLGNFQEIGLVLVNLAEEEEYCEKLMFAHQNQVTPAHAHKKKKEDIICRMGELTVQVWNGHPDLNSASKKVRLKVNGIWKEFATGTKIKLKSGERLTLTPGIFHEFWPESRHCIIGEVSTANDDLNDNFFVDSSIGRFSEVEEDEPATIKLVND